jgi:hypothetical protein
MEPCGFEIRCRKGQSGNPRSEVSLRLAALSRRTKQENTGAITRAITGAITGDLTGPITGLCSLFRRLKLLISLEIPQ